MGREACDDPEGLSIALEPVRVIVLLHEVPKSLFGDVSKRRMPEVVSESRGGSALGMRAMRFRPVLRRRVAP